MAWPFLETGCISPVLRVGLVTLVQTLSLTFRARTPSLSSLTDLSLALSPCGDDDAND